jgi:hypothetical protein
MEVTEWDQWICMGMACDSIRIRRIAPILIDVTQSTIGRPMPF